MNLKPPVDINSLMKEWGEDAIIDSTSIEKEIIKISYLHSKYLNIMSFHRHLARKMESDYKVMKGLRESYYQGHLSEEEMKELGWNPHPHILSNPQITRKLETDEVLNKIILKRIAHEEIVTYCEAVMKSLNNRSWDLKSYVAYLQYIKG